MKSNARGSVFIVDDEKLIRLHLTKILQAAGYTTESFASGEELLARGMSAAPACLLLDVNIVGSLGGPEIQERIQRLGWPLPIVFITAHATVPMTVKAVQNGALDVLIKPIERDLVLKVVAKALAQAREIHHERTAKKAHETLLQMLTRREREVLAWIAAGKLNKQIASHLDITERTVKAHRASLMEKLKLQSVAELVRFADRSGLIPGEKQS